MTSAPVFVATSSESRALESAAFHDGVASLDLMRRAARATVAALGARWVLRDARVGVFVGPGNNGGDGWLVAKELRSAGVPVTVSVVGAPRSADARQAREAACVGGPFPSIDGRETLLVDALMGTGQRHPLSGAMKAAADQLLAARSRGVPVVSLDIPTGIAEAADGACIIDESAVRATDTICFATLKRVLLAARAHAGQIDVVDLGLGSYAAASGLPRLVDAAMVRGLLPTIHGDAHKGHRGRLVMAGGTAGMVGAVILAGRAALASGVGLLHCLVDAQHTGAVHAALPEALVTGWNPHTDRGAVDTLFATADAIVVGPGLGQSAGAAALVADAWATDRPLLIDADALALLEGGRSRRTAPTLLTPHPGEARRLVRSMPAATWTTVADVDRYRDAVALALSEHFGATVLLKGVPTVIADGRALALVPRGTATLATGGSGDVLSGVAGTLLSQGMPSGAAAQCAAWVHGVAAERATASVGGVRGTTLADVLAQLPRSWPRAPEVPPAGVLAVVPCWPMS